MRLQTCATRSQRPSASSRCPVLLPAMAQALHPEVCHLVPSQTATTAVPQPGLSSALAHHPSTRFYIMLVVGNLPQVGLAPENACSGQPGGCVTRR